MSFGAKAANTDSLQNNTAGRTTTLSPRKPVAFGRGRMRTAVEWKTPILHWAYRSSSTSAFAFASIYFWIGLGAADEIAEIIVGDEGYSVVGAFRSELGGEYVDHSINLETPSHWRFWWGLEDHANYGAYLDSLIIDRTHPLAGKRHPNYKGVFAGAVSGLDCGRADSGQTPPLPKLEIAWSKLANTAFSFGYAAHGTHALGIVKDILQEKRGGLALPDSYFDADHWEAQMNRLYDSGIAGIKGTDLFLSRVLTEVKPAMEWVKDILDHLGAFLYERDGKLWVDWSPMDGSTTDPTGLRVIGLDQLVRGEEPQFDPGDLSQLPTQIIVTGLDWQANPQLTEASEAAQVPFARELLGEERPAEQINQPGWVTRDQLKTAANLQALMRALPDMAITLKVQRHYATHADGVQPLRPADRFYWNWVKLGFALVVRVTERSDEDPVSVTLKVRVERGAFPQPYLPTKDPRADITRQPPPDLARYRVAQLPPDLSDAGDTVVAPLIERPNTSAYGFELQLSPDNTWPGQTLVKTTGRWAIAAVLRTGLVASYVDATVTLDTVGADWGALRSQSDLEQADDTVLLYDEGEWFSLGAITPLGGGSYSAQLKRARLGSLPVFHATGATVFLIARADLLVLTNASFAEVESGGAYDAGTATKYFKVRSWNSTANGNFTGAFWTVLRDPTPDVPANLAAATGTGKVVDLTWDPVTAALVNEYSVWRATGPGYADEAQIGSAAAAVKPRFIDIGVALGTTYRYRVKAHATDETESDFSGSVTATPGTVGAGELDLTPPSNPLAPVHVGGGTYLADDGTALAYATVTLKALPAGAIGQNLLYRRTGGGATDPWLVATQRYNAADEVVRLDDLTPGVTYDIGAQGFSVNGAPTAVTMGVAFTAPGRTATPAAPTGVTTTSPTEADGVPVAYEGTEVMNASIGSWAVAADKSVVEYEWQHWRPDPFTGVDIVYRSGVVPAATNAVVFYSSVPFLTGNFRVRAKDRSGNYSAFSSTSGVNWAASYAGNLGRQSDDDVAISALKLGSGTTQQQKATYGATPVITMAGGAPTETQTVALVGFSFPADDGEASWIDGAQPLAWRYVYGDPGNDSTHAVLEARTLDGSNIIPGVTRVSYRFWET